MGPQSSLTIQSNPIHVPLWFHSPEATIPKKPGCRRFKEESV